jgi:hypothetical protein
MMKRIFKYFFLILFSLILVFLIVIFAPALWRHWVTYPRLEKQVNAFQALRKEPPMLTTLHTYRGVMHVHSYLSHDSEGTIYDLTTAAKTDGINFIFLTDHPRYDLDTIPKGYHGNYDGILIESGSEKQGFDCWPLDSTVINWKINKDTVAKNVVANGGIIFYAHTEEPHNWANPYYQGMEIYNFHTDTKDESLFPNIINFLVNGKKYRPWALREMFDEQTAILARWDSLNMHRKIVGFSAVDTHENQNFRARKLKDGRVQWVGPNAKPIDTVKVSIWNRWLFGKPDPDGWILKWMIDTYPSGFNYITNYVLADTLSVPSLAENIKKGHLFTAFKSLGDAKGFLYYAVDQNGQIDAILGDSIQVKKVKALKAVSPLPGRFRLIHDGKPVDQSADDIYEYSWSGKMEKGAYRIEIRIPLQHKKVPWLYSNPIYIY